MDRVCAGSEGGESMSVVQVTVSRPLFEFKNLRDWVMNAKDRYEQAGVSSRDSIAVDELGRICICGGDFSRAEEQDAYPIKVYSVQSALYGVIRVGIPRETGSEAEAFTAAGECGVREPVSEWPILMTGWSMQRILRRVKTQTRRMNRQWLKRHAGDVLWCKETWGVEDGYLIFRVDLDDWSHCPDLKWKSAMLMPREHCRQRIQLTADPYLEPVQHISTADAIAEGCESCSPYDEYRAIWEKINGKNPLHCWGANPEVVVLKFEALS